MRSRWLALLLFLTQTSYAAPNRIPTSKLVDQMMRRSTLAEPEGKPFYLKATITDRDDAKSEFNGTVEEYWMSPTKWRRVVKLRDFSQTHIVNGDLVFEQNNGDYFPVHDEMLANEIVDPLPRSAIELMNRLEMMATEPGSGEGQCMSEKYFNDADGRETRVLLAYNCKTGLLIYLSSPTCCYGVMTDYRKFHNKLVAYATKDDRVNIRIDTLRDLDAPDESLFTVAEPTPLEKRMITTTISETGARALIIEKPEIQWPSVTKKPTVSSIKVDIVIGRDGKVKEARSYSPVENAVEDAVLSTMRKWTFQPQNVSGVPAQVQTELLIPFPASYLAVTSGQPDAAPIFEKMRAAHALRVEGAPAFHMKASFHSEKGDAKGTYEETWISPNKWRRELRLNDIPVVEVQTDHDFYRTFAGKYAPRLADDLIDSLAFTLPGDNGSSFQAADWKVINAKLGEVPVLRLSNGYINPQGRPDPFTSMFFVAEQSSLIRGRFHYSSVTVFNDFQAFEKTPVPRKLTLFSADSDPMEITIETLEAAPNPDESLFRVSGAKPAFTVGEEDPRFTSPHPIYMVRPSIAIPHGKVTCGVKVDEHGHVRDVDVNGISYEPTVKSIRDALMQWEFEPATINGHPSLGFTQVNVE